MRFPYRAYEVAPTPASPAPEGLIYRPVIPFALLGPAGVLDFFGLLDTGADETYITRNMAERLGLTFDETPSHIIESAGGEVAVTYAQVTIEVTDRVDHFLWPATVGVTDQEWIEAILGHGGFLEYFDVLFRSDVHDLILSRNGSILPND
ncbi:MAG: aspartyl protease family protein [Pirellulales bacterium]